MLGPTTSEYPSEAFQDEQHPTEDGLLIEGPLIIHDLDVEKETFTLQNISAEPVHLDGWRVHDQTVQDQKSFQNLFDFYEKSEGLVLPPGGLVSIYCGKDSSSAREYDNKRHIHWFNEHVWSADGDRAYLVNPEGEIVHILSVLDGDANGYVRPGVDAKFSPSKSVTYHYQRAADGARSVPKKRARRAR